MTEPDRVDEFLVHTLRRELGPIADNGFSGSVVRQLQQRRLLRALALSAASVAGLLVALMPASRLLEKLSAELTRAVDDLTTSQSPDAVGTVLEALQVRDILARLSRQIMDVFTLSGDAAWLGEHQTVIMTTLLALAGTAAVRLLVR